MALQSVKKIEDHMNYFGSLGSPKRSFHLLGIWNVFYCSSQAVVIKNFLQLRMLCV